jgi:hypothetical protein
MCAPVQTDPPIVTTIQTMQATENARSTAKRISAYGRLRINRPTDVVRLLLRTANG